MKVTSNHTLAGLIISGERKFTFVLATHPCRTSLVVVLKPTVSRKGAGDYRTWSLIGTGCVEVVVAIARKLPLRRPYSGGNGATTCGWAGVAAIWSSAGKWS